MKEATGELNMTVITVVAIAAVAAFFYAFVWPAIKWSLLATTACNSLDSSGAYSSNGVECSNWQCSPTGDSSSLSGGVRNCDNNK